MDDAFALLTRGVSAMHRGSPPPAQTLIAEVVGSGALVHGFAMLMLDRRLDHILAHLPKGADARDLLRAVLETK